jgi:hypothetical protein
MEAMLIEKEREIELLMKERDSEVAALKSQLEEDVAVNTWQQLRLLVSLTNSSVVSMLE